MFAFFFPAKIPGTATPVPDSLREGTLHILVVKAGGGSQKERRSSWGGAQGLTMAALPKPSSQRFPDSLATPFGVSLGTAGGSLGSGLRRCRRRLYTNARPHNHEIPIPIVDPIMDL